MSAQIIKIKLKIFSIKKAKQKKQLFEVLKKVL